MNTNTQGLQGEDKNLSLPWTRENYSALYLQKSQIPLSPGELQPKELLPLCSLPVNFQLIPDQGEFSAGLQSCLSCLSLLLLLALAVHQQPLPPWPREHSWGKGRHLFMCSREHLRHRARELETHNSSYSAKGFSVCCTIHKSWKNFHTTYVCSSVILSCTSGFSSKDSVTVP